MGTVTHRLGQFLEYRKMSIYAFEKHCGLTKNRINNAINGGTDMGVSNLVMISNKCPELNMHWLVTGHGSMLLGDAPAVVDCAEYERENYELLRENRALRLELEALKKSVGVTGDRVK